ncbi:MAG: UDP-glucose 4-epimerase [Chitinophagales bacterium]|nr:MAG: UDP-glucose 4-epimerase [Chitinophagales bacterium]
MNQRSDKPKILVTGGCGYIGAHTLADLMEHEFPVISTDNLSRGTTRYLDGLKSITGKNTKNYVIDLCEYERTREIFAGNRDIRGIIHFAAFKTVPESVRNPLLYFRNNLISVINLLRCVEEFHIPYFVFSSSCSVYGNPPSLPVTEDTPLSEPESPYARTKQMGEKIILDFSRAFPHTTFISLRYFNPVGAHPSSLIGEYAVENPENLVPIITQTAIGKRDKLTVYGNDYNTRDGTCIRDYIHVMDIAHAHTLAMQYLLDGKNHSPYEVFNLGTGNGVTVLEAIKAFEKVSGVQLNYEMGPRRKGDVEAIYANNTLAKQRLGWTPRYTLDDMMLTAWKWELRLAGKLRD